MITSETGITGLTVKFIKTYKSGRAVSVIMTNEEIVEIGTIEDVEKSLSENWKQIIRKFNLLVEVE